jgi:hypothetical protein
MPFTDASGQTFVELFQLGGIQCEQKTSVNYTAEVGMPGAIVVSIQDISC